MFFKEVIWTFKRMNQGKPEKLTMKQTISTEKYTNS